MSNRLIRAAMDAANLFRAGGTPERPEIRELVRAAEELREGKASGPHDHQDDCLMCAVRALTEGEPTVKWPTPESMAETVSGVVLRQGELSTNLGPVRFVDLWTGGNGRVRVMAYAATMRSALDQAAAQIGDRLQVWYDGEGQIDRPGRPTHGMSYKRYSVNVQRGH